MRKALFSSTFLLLFITAFSAAWPQFRGNPAETGWASEKLSKKIKLLWTFEAGAGVISTPALTTTEACFGTEGKKFICLDLLAGKKKWDFSSKGEIHSSALVLEGRVFFGDDAGCFYALEETTGKELWRFEAKDKIISSPNYGGSGVFFGSYDGNLYSLDRKDGKLLWAFETDSPIHGSPSVTDNYVISAGCDGKLRFLNIFTGKEEFNISLESNIVSSPAVSQGRVFISSLAGKFFSADIKERNILWDYFEEGNEQCYSSPALTEKSVFFGTRGNFLRCLSRETGKLLWSFTAKGGIDASPVIISGDSGEIVYFGSSDGKMYGLQTADGKKTFEYDTGSAITGSLSVSEGKIVFGTDGGLVYCFTGDDKNEVK
ncbi:MAG: PQQ-binding-like beta-propeller repeat protein [Candidatus Firestonebacteria bacterium]